MLTVFPGSRFPSVPHRVSSRSTLTNSLKLNHTHTRARQFIMSDIIKCMKDIRPDAHMACSSTVQLRRFPESLLQIKAIASESTDDSNNWCIVRVRLSDCCVTALYNFRMNVRKSAHAEHVTNTGARDAARRWPWDLNWLQVSEE